MYWTGRRDGKDQLWNVIFAIRFKWEKEDSFQLCYQGKSSTEGRNVDVSGATNLSVRV